MVMMKQVFSGSPFLPIVIFVQTFKLKGKFALERAFFYYTRSISFVWLLRCGFSVQYSENTLDSVGR